MGATGSAVLDFGTSSKPAASVDVTGQASIVADSKIEAFVRLVATADHSIDEHRLEQLKIMAGNIVAGTGFTIYGEAYPQTSGLWNVDWVWV